MLVAGDPKELEAIMRGVVKRRKAKPEEVIHRTVVQHLKARARPGVVWWHTPNGGKRNVIEAAKFKAMGVRPGVSDICILHSGKFYALELKADNGRPTEAQMEFISDVNAAGGFGCIAAGLDQAIGCLERWGIIR